MVYIVRPCPSLRQRAGGLHYKWLDVNVLDPIKIYPLVTQDCNGNQKHPQKGVQTGDEVFNNDRSGRHGSCPGMALALNPLHNEMTTVALGESTDDTANQGVREHVRRYNCTSSQDFCQLSDQPASL